MITNDVIQAREDIKAITTLSYIDIQLIRRFHPIAQALIVMPISKAIAAGHTITIATAPQMVIDRFNEICRKYDQDGLIANNMDIAKTYGFSGMIIGDKNSSSGEPILLSKLSESCFLNNVDPLNMAGSNQFNQQPNDKQYLQSPKAIRVNGIGYHPSRCKSFFNPFEPSQYLSYNQGAFTFAPPSVFERVLPYLIMMLENDDALSSGNKKVGGFIHKKAFLNQSVIDQANRSVVGYIKEKVVNFFNGDVAVIAAGDEITTPDLAHFSQALDSTSELILNRIAMSSSDGIPASMLKSAMLGRGMSEGDNDKKIHNECIEKHRKALDPLYEFTDILLFFIATNDPDFYALVQKQHPEYKSIGHTTARMAWWNSFKREWNPIEETTEPEALDIAEKKSNLSRSVIELAQAVQLPQETILDLLDTHISNINDVGVLANKFDFDVMDLRLQLIEEKLNPQQQSDMGETE